MQAASGGQCKRLNLIGRPRFQCKLASKPSRTAQNPGGRASVRAGRFPLPEGCPVGLVSGCPVARVMLAFLRGTRPRAMAARSVAVSRPRATPVWGPKRGASQADVPGLVGAVGLEARGRHILWGPHCGVCVCGISRQAPPLCSLPWERRSLPLPSPLLCRRL